jgi:phosphoserine phosphatase RsbU/P
MGLASSVKWQVSITSRQVSFNNKNLLEDASASKSPIPMGGNKDNLTVFFNPKVALSLSVIDSFFRGVETERMSEQDKLLREKILELQDELAKKDQDLKIYKRELTQANQQLEHLIVQVNDQLQQAQRIQKFLVPTEFPNIQGFEFSTKFSSSSVAGGDYFDIFEHYDKMRFGLFLSSASGYGMSSLFLSALMKMTYEIEDTKSKDPCRVVQDILVDIQEQCQPKDQASLFYGVFDRRKFQLTYCNLGQPLAIHYSAASKKIDLLQGSHEPFVAQSNLDQYQLSNHVIDLEPEDKLVICSSGFLALANNEGQSWGLESILSVVKQNIGKDVHGLRNEIFYQAQRYSPLQPKDLTVIVTEVKDRIIKLA